MSADQRRSRWPGGRWGIGAAVVVVVGLGILVRPTSGHAGGAEGEVRVMYPASLTALMEQWIGPAFHRSTGYTLVGEGSGSLAMANLIRSQMKFPDVFVSSDPSADRALTGGHFVSWWLDLGRSQLVLAWNPASRFAADFNLAKEQLVTTESVLEQPGLRLCRADPDADPEGFQTLFAFDLDQRRSGQAGLEPAILGPDHNAAQVFPPESLGERAQAGSCDVIAIYEAEALEDELPFLALPPAISLGDPALQSLYATVSYRTSQGQRITGAPITFTVTIPSTVRSAAGAVAFVRFLLGSQGQSLMTDQGLVPVPPAAGGYAAAVPQSINTFIATHPAASPSDEGATSLGVTPATSGTAGG